MVNRFCWGPRKLWLLRAAVMKGTQVAKESIELEDAATGSPCRVASVTLASLRLCEKTVFY